MGRESACQCRRRGLDPWSGKKNPTCPGLTKSGSHNNCACALESRGCNAEPTAATEAGTPTAGAPQQEKSPGRKENPAQTQINKLINKQRLPPELCPMRFPLTAPRPASATPPYWRVPSPKWNSGSGSVSAHFPHPAPSWACPGCSSWRGPTEKREAGRRAQSRPI